MWRMCAVTSFLPPVRSFRTMCPHPRRYIAFTPESALEAIETLGYPAVLKPAVGSWGRLISKVNDREAAEAVLEHKSILGSVPSLYLLHPRVHRQTAARHPHLCGGRRDDLRHLSHLGTLDHQHGARRICQQLPDHAGARSPLAGGGPGRRRRRGGHRHPRAILRDGCSSTR
jgi:hypothetical protein